MVPRHPVPAAKRHLRRPRTRHLNGAATNQVICEAGRYPQAPVQNVAGNLNGSRRYIHPDQ